MTTNTLSYGDHGPQVKTLQRLLAGSRFGNFHPGPIDGQFGPRTASAVQRAKRALGYQRRDVQPTAGHPLVAYLRGEKNLGPAMKVRRAARLAARARRRKERSKQAVMRLRALAIIKGELGTMERGENVIKYNAWWGWGAVAYCVIGISWAWVKAGSKSFARGARWANTDAMLADAKAGRNGLSLESDPLPGTPGVIDFDGHADPDHAITYLRGNGDGTCETVEFNAVGQGIEGVVRKDRPLRNCWWFEVAG